MHEKLSREQLIDKYSAGDVKLKIVDLLDLRSFLQQCVIRGDYKVPDKLNDVLQLSEYGEWLVKRAVAFSRSGQPKINPKIARLTCLLEFYHRDFLIDVENSDPSELASAISDELLARHILLPFVHGPELYERAADLFPDEQSWLSTPDTLKLLDGQPIGVFQMGRWVSGPYGLGAVQNMRDIRPSLRVPLQHCHDVSCRVVHATFLSTDASAKVNEARGDIAKILEAEGEDPSDFAPFFVDLAESFTDEYDDTLIGGLGYLVADSLSLHEMTKLTVALLRNETLNVRERVRPFVGPFKSPESLVEGMGRAELLQLILTCSDAEIAPVLDGLVFGGQFRIPDGEVRRPVLHSIHVGAFANVPELSSLGLRTSSRQHLGPLRLRRLIETVYLSADPTSNVQPQSIADVEELSWQLRSVNGVTVEARLDEYLRTASPEDVLRRLILAHQRYVEVALSDLMLCAEGVDDETLILRMLWKLGFDVSAPLMLHERFWRLHERMVHTARAANVSTIVDQEAMRGLSANYFVALEHLLSDSLAFGSWVLTADHVTERRPFSFDGADHADEGFRRLLPPDDPREKPSEGWTLYPLCKGFADLADVLETASAHATSHLRDPSTYPAFAGKTTLQHFPFEHSLAFLDLTASSRKRVVQSLRSASEALLRSRSFEVRNEQLHFRRSNSDVDKLITALTEVETAVRLLEDAGFTRIMFFPDRSESDRWGRSTIYFNDRRGREIALGRPSPYSWLNMPSLSDPQYLVLAAQFAEPNEVIRVRLDTDSEFRQLWSRFPQRRRKTRARIDDPQTSDKASTEVNPESLRA